MIHDIVRHRLRAHRSCSDLACSSRNAKPFISPMISQAANHLLFAAFAFAAFFLLLLIMTIAKKLPTTADPSSVRMTGMRIAQTRGGKSS